MIEDQDLLDQRQEFFDGLAGGTICPCCERYAKRYRRKIHSGMARVLINLYQLTKHGSWVDYRRACLVDGRLIGRDFTILRYWGLVEQCQDPKWVASEKGTQTSDNSELEQRPGSGLWRVTQHGREFVQGTDKAAAWVEVFADKVVGRAESTIDIHQALGAKFNYTELMNA